MAFPSTTHTGHPHWATEARMLCSRTVLPVPGAPTTIRFGSTAGRQLSVFPSSSTPKSMLTLS